MAEYFSGIKPSNGFYVSSSYNYTHVHQDILISLYTPLIGTDAIGIYLYLSQFNFHNETHAHNHYTVMSDLKINLTDFRNALDLLEGIGLLKTFMKTNEEEQTFVYCLEQPSTAEQFFNDPLLSVFLYQQIGKARFLDLRKRYKDESISLDGFHEVTKTFTDIFKIPKLSEGEIDDNVIIKREVKNKGIDLSNVTFDFEMLEMLLNNHLISKALLNKKTKEVIIQIAVLYGISPIEMKSIILKSITQNQTISLEDLRKHARSIYQIEHEGQLPTLELKKGNIKDTANTKKEVDSLSSWFELLDNTSPIEMLSSFTKSEPTISQKRLVEDLITREKLPYGVLNILLQYVMFKNNMQLPKAYIEEIASNWKKLNIKNAKEAYQHTKEFDKQVEDKKKEKATKATNSNYKLKSIEKTPEWLLKQKEDQVPKEQDKVSSNEFEKRKKELQQEMEKFWKEGD